MVHSTSPRVAWTMAAGEGRALTVVMRAYTLAAGCHESDPDAPHQDNRPFEPSGRALRRAVDGGRCEAAGRRAIDALLPPLPAVRPRAAGQKPRQGRHRLSLGRRSAGRQTAT